MTGKTFTRWDARKDAAVAARYGTVPNRVLAADLGVTVPALKNRAVGLGLTWRTKTRWTPGMDAALREKIGTKPGRELAADLGVKAASLRQRASHLGLGGRGRAYMARPPRAPSPPRFRVTPETDAAVARFHARGMTDGQAAAELGCSTDTVARRRKALGLAANRKPRRPRRLRLGVRAKLAARYGLPPDLPPYAVALAVALAAGPKTAREAHEAAGLRYERVGRRAITPRPKGHASWLSYLVARGLAVRLYVGTTRVYLLTPHALDSIAGGRT